jgi:hypothetical protein
MNDQFDELAKNLAQSVTRALLCLAAAAQFAWAARAADIYVDANAMSNGDGSATHPHWRITDAVASARTLRQSATITSSENIVIHVAAGAYLGSKASPVLARNPRYEVLPILLNVPNLTLSGAMVLTTDADGLPTGVQPGTDTLLATEDHYNDQGKSLILLSRTTDGMAGHNVTVSGLRLEYLNGRYQVDSGIIVDRVSNFSIRQNFINRAWAGIYSSRASGSIAGNLITEGDWGIVAKGGSRFHPAQYGITGNRVSRHPHNGILIEASGVTPEIDVGANTLKLESLPLSEVSDDPPFTNDATVNGNDASDNGYSGLRLFIYSPPIKPIVPMLPVSPHVTVTASNNTLNRNGAYGLVVDGNLASRSIKSPLGGAISGQFSNNALEDNARAPAFFTFTSFFVWCCGASLKDIKYIQDSTFQITDVEGELAGFDYDNPITDPFDGTVLNNTLIVNGAIVPPGTKISPLAP